MKILIIDDEEERHNGFKESLSEGNDLFHAHHFDEAVAMIEEHGPFDIAFFDHDLHDFINTGYGVNERTGLTILSWMNRFIDASKWPKEIIIHSWNVVGAQSIFLKCRDMGVKATLAPFAAPTPKNKL